jgi:hypothetical protein
MGNAPKGLSVIELAMSDILDIHDKLDKLEIPNVLEGEKLSASQRVSILIGAYKSACTRVCKGE